ncbi:MAG: hypothetical protein LBQ16_00625 [Gracilibacteraceae bacterium]|nr:hypothetical protein [Gracilibacteraceae bacterium]
MPVVSTRGQTPVEPYVPAAKKGLLPLLRRYTTAFNAAEERQAFSFADLEEWGCPYGATVSDVDLEALGMDEEEVRSVREMLELNSSEAVVINSASFGLAEFYRSRTGGMIDRTGRFKTVAFVQSWAEAHKGFPGPRNIAYGMSLSEIMDLFPVQNTEAGDFARNAKRPED